MLSKRHFATMWQNFRHIKWQHRVNRKCDNATWQIVILMGAVKMDPSSRVSSPEALIFLTNVCSSPHSCSMTFLLTFNPVVEFGKMFGPSTLIFSNLKILFSEESQRRLGIIVDWIDTDKDGQVLAEIDMNGRTACSAVNLMICSGSGYDLKDCRIRPLLFKAYL